MRIPNWLLGLFCLLSTLPALAQQPHFIYLQSEKFAPFFVKLNGKHLSSTAAGYLVLPKLAADSSYAITLGLAGSTEMQDYVLAVNGKDAGYLIKNFGDKGWGLQDLQTGAVQMSHEASSKLAYAEAEKLKLAEKARQDSIAKEAAEYAGLDTVKKETPVVAADTAIAAAPAAVTAEAQVKKDTLAAATEKKEARDGEKAANVVAGAAVAGGVAVAAGDSKAAKKDAPKFLDMEMGGDSTAANPAAAVVVPKPADSLAVAKTEPARDSVMAKPATDSIIVQPPLADSNKVVADEAVGAKTRVPCVAMATREDAEKLLAMPAATADDMARLTEAYNKLFAQKCVYTSQLSKMAKMLPNDQARYQLFESAWAHTIDYFNFGELRSTISDAALIAKFNKLLQ